MRILFVVGLLDLKLIAQRLKPADFVARDQTVGEIGVVGGFREDRSSSPEVDLYSPTRDSWRRLTRAKGPRCAFTIPPG